MRIDNSWIGFNFLASNFLFFLLSWPTEFLLAKPQIMARKAEKPAPAKAAEAAENDHNDALAPSSGVQTEPKPSAARSKAPKAPAPSMEPKTRAQKAKAETDGNTASTKETKKTNKKKWNTNSIKLC